MSFEKTPDPFIRPLYHDPFITTPLSDPFIRHVVLRVPGLWWMVPLFYIPVLSRAVGRRIYNWVATHRHEISACGTTTAACGVNPRKD